MPAVRSGTHPNRLAHLETDQQGDLLAMLFDQIGEVLEDLAAGSWVQPRPGTMIECRTRRSHGRICVSRLRPGEIDECRAVSRRVHCPSRAVDRCRRSPPMNRPSGSLVSAASCRQSVAATGSETMRSTSLSGVDQSIELKYVWALTIAGRSCGTSTAVDPRTTSSDRQGRG